MAIQIQILSKEVITKPTAKGSYQQLELSYKNLTFQGKVEGRKLMSFGATANSFKELAAANGGDVFEIEIVKNDKGYNDWVSAKKSSGASGSSPQSSGTVAPSTGNSSTPVRSTYETPEERAKKQIYIVRQSSISAAIDLLSVGSKTPPDVDAVLGVAQRFEDFVFGASAEAVVSSDFSTLKDSEIE